MKEYSGKQQSIKISEELKSELRNSIMRQYNIITGYI